MRLKHMKSIDIHGFLCIAAVPLWCTTREKRFSSGADSWRICQKLLKRFVVSTSRKTPKGTVGKDFCITAWQRAKRCLNCEIKIYGSRFVGGATRTTFRFVFHLEAHIKSLNINYDRTLRSIKPFWCHGRSTVWGREKLSSHFPSTVKLHLKPQTGVVLIRIYDCAVIIHLPHH